MSQCICGRRDPSAVPLIIALALILYPNAANSQIVKWELGATIVEFEDPDMAFPNVRLGDPVRGFLSFNLSTAGDNEDPNDVLYEHNPGFEVAGMVIENPRDDTEMEIVPDRAFITDVEIANDQEAEEIGLIDSIVAFQSVEPPGDYLGFAPTIGIFLNGPPETLPDARLPATLNLDDWPDATMVFFDFFDLIFGEGEGGYIAAEIHTLTPVAVPEVAGDFNNDGTVDAADYIVWRSGLGTDFNQTHYDTWRANFGLSDLTSASAPGSAGGSNGAVPEPTTILLAALSLVVSAAQWRRRVSWPKITAECPTAIC